MNTDRWIGYSHIYELAGAFNVILKRKERNTEMLRPRNALPLMAMFMLSILIGVACILGSNQDFQKGSKITRSTATSASSNTTACPKTDISLYTEHMKELRKLRPLFDFSLTPLKLQHDGYSSNRDPNVTWSMVIMVKSHAKNIWKRRIARATWAGLNYHNGVRMETIFVVGKAESPEGEMELLNENKKFGDLLQIDKPEKYADVVFKTLAGMQYAVSHFPCNWIYTSADDDVMPNFTKIHQNVENFIIDPNDVVDNNSCLEYAPIRILCGYSRYELSPPHRTKKDKWFVSISEYPYKTYPPYCLGPWYSMRIRHTGELYDLSRRYPILWIDDVWITGTLRLKQIQSDKKVKCKPTELSWGLDDNWLVVVDEVDRLVEIWLRYLEKHVLVRKT